MILVKVISVQRLSCLGRGIGGANAVLNLLSFSSEVSFGRTQSETSRGALEKARKKHIIKTDRVQELTFEQSQMRKKTHTVRASF